VLSVGVFDTIGPKGVGPSSSHTLAAVKIGQAVFAQLGGVPKSAEIQLFGSFARTFRGHKTDVAIVGGLLGFNPTDSRVKDSFEHAKNVGMRLNIVPVLDVEPNHPNTVKIRVHGNGLGNVTRLEVIGISLGGGTIKTEMVQNS